MSRPQQPEICAGFSDRRWSLASWRLTGFSSGSQVEQHSSRPQRPTPPRRAASSRTPICLKLDPGAERACQVPDQLAEVDPPLGGEVDDQLVPVELPLGLGDLHLEAVLLHQLAGLAAHPLLVAAQRVQPPRVTSSRARQADHPLLGVGVAHPPEEEHLRSAMAPTAETSPRSSPRSASTMTSMARTQIEVLAVL